MVSVLAVDLGASSARVAAVDLTTSSLEIVHRVAHRPVAVDGILRWDWPHLVDAVRVGLRRGLAAGPVASIGIDTWGVDYGLVDRSGRLVEAPISYLSVSGFAPLPLDPIHRYRTTGIQDLAINTIYQLAAHDRTVLARASHVLMLPSLLIHELCGAVTAERTSAGTTGLVDLSTATWSEELLAAIDVDPALFPPIRPPLAPVGAFDGVPIHLVGGHDTASAVLAAGPGVFIASGSWMLVGVTRPAPDVSDAARAANFSNEPGVLDGVRFLRNVVGLSLLSFVDGPLAPILAAAARLPAGGPIIDVADPATPAAVAAIRPIERAVRCAIDSIAFGVAGVIDQLRGLVGPVTEVTMVGGGAANPLLVRALSDACGVDIRVGPVEATAIGNAMAQGLALGA